MPTKEWFKSQWTDIKGNAKWALLGGVWWLTISIGKYFLNHYTPLMPWATWLILLGVSLLIFFLLARSLRHHPAGQTATGPAIIPVQATPNFDSIQFFRTAYYSQVTDEAEKNIRLAAAQNQPNDREGYLAKLIGLGLVSYLHDMCWAYIYKSQLLMLTELNRRGGLMPLNDAKPYYDRAVNENPHLYGDYPLDGWLEFMRGQQLIIRHPTDMLEITIRGRDFLKYLTHWGRSIDVRRG